MKKTLAVILSVLMLVCSIPFAAIAAESDPWTSGGQITLGSSLLLESNKNYTLASGGVLTVPSNVTAYIPSNCTVRILEGATLRCLGRLVVYGSLVVEGIVEGDGASHIEATGTGSATAAVRFPSVETLDNSDLTGRIKIKYGVTEEGNVYEDMAEDFEWTELTDPNNRTHYFSLNQFLHIKVEIIENELPFDKYDDSKMTVFVNGVEVPYGRGSCSFRVTTSVDISFRGWTNENDFLNVFNIHLPSGEGYAVYGREGEQSAVGETVQLRYGQPFAFRVEVDPEYDMSEYEVYIYDGYGWISLDPNNQDLSGITPAMPDQYGYYVIDSVKGELQIQVKGIVKNETILMIGSILDFVKNIFDMISGFFQEIMAFFGLAAGGETA